jgi:UDP-glucuronate decarboxylase
MHVFVTGGTGFFGKALLRYWSAGGLPELTGTRFTLLSRDPERFRVGYGELLAGLNVELVAGDIQRPETLPAGDYTHILHAATDSTFGPQLTPLQRYNQIVDGTRNILDFAVAHKVGRFLLTSSGGVYGAQPSEMMQMPESYNGMPNPLNPNHAYSVAKRCAEHLCALYKESHGLETVIARCFAFVGRDLPLDVHFAIGNFIRDALSAPEITVAGDGTPIRSFMDQRDLAAWLFALLQRGTPGQAYNVGSDEEVCIRDLAHLVQGVLAPEKPVRILGTPTLNSFRNRYVPSIAKASDELGLSLSFSLADSVQEAARYTVIEPKR